MLLNSIHYVVRADRLYDVFILESEQMVQIKINKIEIYQKYQNGSFQLYCSFH